MLDLITAILAFAAIMIMLATLVTVLVESVQKVFRMRRDGLQQMLEGLYETSIRGQVGAQLERASSAAVSKGEGFHSVAKSLGEGSDSSIQSSMSSAAREASRLASQEKKDNANEYFVRKVAAAQFAEQLMRNPIFDRIPARSALGRIMGWIRRRLVTDDFENIDTRQFIEQLANTEAGDKLASLAEQELKPLLRTISYQFERFGEAASDYFARRAWVLSVVISILLAFAVNIDSVRIFRTLVINPSVSGQVRQSFEALKAANVEKAAQPAPSQSEETGTGAETTGLDASSNRGRSDAAKDADTKLKEALEQTKEALAKFNGQGIPIGRDYFPFCGTVDVDKDNCDGVPPQREKFTKTVGFFGPPLDWLSYQPHWVRWVFARANGWWWFFSTLLAGGLIGLGAPFWYDIYRKAALVLPVAQVAARFVSSGRKTVTITPQEVASAVTTDGTGKPNAKSLPRALRRSDRATISPDDLYDAFIRARSGPGAMPPASHR